MKERVKRKMCIYIIDEAIKRIKGLDVEDSVRQTAEYLLLEAEVLNLSWDQEEVNQLLEEFWPKTLDIATGKGEDRKSPRWFTAECLWSVARGLQNTDKSIMQMIDEMSIHGDKGKYLAVLNEFEKEETNA